MDNSPGCGGPECGRDTGVAQKYADSDDRNALCGDYADYPVDGTPVYCQGERRDCHAEKHWVPKQNDPSLAG